MALEFDIQSLFALVHGYESEAFAFADVTGFADVNDFNRKEFGDYGTPYYADDQFGREYFMPVTVSFPDKDKIVQGLITGNVNMLKSWDLPYPVVAIRPAKQLVETAMTERGGSVFQLINDGSFEIVVKGVLLAKTNEYPEDQVKQFRDVFAVKTTMQLRCAATDIWLNGVGYNVVVTGASPMHTTGVKNVVGYEVVFKSNVIVDLIEIGE